MTTDHLRIRTGLWADGQKLNVLLQGEPQTFTSTHIQILKFIFERSIQENTKNIQKPPKQLLLLHYVLI